ncbi:MAG: DNA polymerase III subunit beta [Bacteroidales bacterium OttesenSCG-928-I14]|jgi:DNA polymerase-3 subunit beta|nr:DNA polymerase III subunit beta [Bacteroidales bacterium OttesenSCG-928-I14]
MKFVVQSNLLLNRLQLVGKVILTKNIIPILDCFLFQLSGNKLIITSSDTETRMNTYIEVQEVEGVGEFAITSKNLLDALRELPNQLITFEMNITTCEVFIYYKNGKYNFISQNGSEYPVFRPLQKDIHSLTMNIEDLLTAISYTLFAAGNDELRPIMSGIFFEITPKYIAFVSSDGHRLSRFKKLNMSENVPSSFIFPKKPANLLRSILLREKGEITINFDLNYAHINLQNFTLISRLLEGNYPDYNSVIPSENPYKIVINRLELLNALKRVNLFSDPGNNLIKLQILTNKIILTAQDIDYSISAEEFITCNYTGNNIIIGFKGIYLIEILNSILSEKIILELADASRAGLIIPVKSSENDEDLLMLLMPIMLST